MPGQYTLHAYDADVFIKGFMGVNNVFTEIDGDLRYAAEAENVETPNGVLQPQAASTVMDGGEIFASKKIETLATFHRRWYTGPGSHDWLIACADGKMYQRQAGEDTAWEQVPMPTGVASYGSNVWSWVTYEQNVEPAEDDAYTVDVMLLTNQEDGMVMVSPPDRPRLWGDVATETWDTMDDNTWDYWRTPTWLTTAVPISDTGYKFGVIERYAERIWGGNVAGEPDLLVYSRPYDPTDWSAPGAGEPPEDGAGEVRQPTWDGDSFTALMAFGNQLIAFKQHRVWQISGTNPGEYAFKEQYGDGTTYKGTIVRDVERIWMADGDGLNYYDGMSVRDFARVQLEQIWRRVNRSAMGEMCAALFRNRYYLAIPIDGSAVNNALLVFNQPDGTFLFYKDVYIESLLATTDVLYATSSNLPGQVIEVGYDSWKTGAASGAATKWVTPWMDFNLKRIVKGGFDIYFTPEVQTEAVTLKISIQTEKKDKTKTYTVQPLTAAEKAAGKQHKMKRLHIGGSGRRFRMVIETDAGVTAPWRLIGGIQMVVETDPD